MMTTGTKVLLTILKITMLSPFGELRCYIITVHTANTIHFKNSKKSKSKSERCRESNTLIRLKN